MPSYKNNTGVAQVLTGDGDIRRLEQRFQQQLQNRLHCLSVMNATCGLSSVLRTLSPGRVVTPLFTSPATYAAITHAGHEAIFADIEPTSLCISPKAVSVQLNKDVRAILCVNIFGHCGDLENLRQLANDVGAMLIVDAAQSLATCLNNPAYSSIADAVVFSLGPQKLTGCADGGIIAVKSIDLWHKLVQLTQHPFRQMLDVVDRAPNLEHYNYRMNPYSAKEAWLALQNIKSRISGIQKMQRKVLKQLFENDLIEPLPLNPDIIFQPLTVLPLKSNLAGYNLYNLPIPARLDLAKSYDLPETCRQFQRRKVLAQKARQNKSKVVSNLDYGRIDN